MSRIVEVALRIDGQYRDLWLYKNRIYLWSRTGQLFYLHVDDAMRAVLRETGQALANLVQTLIFRNDWKVGEQLQNLLRVPEVSAAYFKPFAQSDVVEIRLPIDLFTPSGSESYPGPVLDSSIYANRLYLATPDGIFESYINPRYPDRTYGLDKQADFRASSVAVRSAAINASAGDSGLFFGRIALNASDDAPGFQKLSWNRVDDYSISAGYSNKNLLNYRGGGVPNLLRARTEAQVPHANARYEEKQIVGYDEPLSLASVARSAFSAASSTSRQQLGASGLPEDELEILGNSEFHLLTSWNDSLRVLNLRAFEGPDIEARVDKQFSAVDLNRLDPELLLETYPINRGFVTEFQDSLSIITKSGSFPLRNAAAARVRTFASSLRHKEVVATVEEEASYVIGFYILDDTLF